MKKYLIYLLIFLASLLQVALFKINLVLIAVILWTCWAGKKQSLWLAFLGGVFLDLAKNSTLGISSFSLLVVCLFLLLYREKLSPFHPLFLMIFTFLSGILFDLVLFRIIHWWNIILSLLVVLLVRFLIVGLFGYGGREKLRLT